MKLFDDFEAVRFAEEDLIFITHNGYLYYIYDPKYKNWRKYGNAGNDSITVNNYQEISKEELAEAMGGKFPDKETDFIRLCDPEQLFVKDMLALLKEDFPNYMADGKIYHPVHRFLLESSICHKSFIELKELFRKACLHKQDSESVIRQIKDLTYNFIGRDIYKNEIGIVDGHDSSSYFWIMPVRVVDYTDTNSLDCVAEMRSAEISIEEDDVAQFLTPFLYKYFDDELEANKKRVDSAGIVPQFVDGFEWYLTHNFYTHDSIKNIINDIKDTIEALSSGRENEFTVKLKEKRGSAAYQLVYARNLTDEQIRDHNDNRPTVDSTESDLIIDFYYRFIYRLEYMTKIGKEKGFDLISFMGP